MENLISLLKDFGIHYIEEKSNESLNIEIRIPQSEDAFMMYCENTRDFSHGMNRLHMLLKYFE